LINKYYGHTQEQFCIECSFAGDNDEFIVCGSEDASIYIWHRSNSIPFSVIKGHTGSVNNCLLSFYFNKPFMFSISDDFTLRLWTSQTTEILYEDMTAVKSNRKVSDVYKENYKNNHISGFDSNLIENQISYSSNHSESEDENESEI
jgi:WD40 repeat protein